MDALTLLKADHDKVKNMLNKLDETTQRAEVTRTEGLQALKAGAHGPRDDRGSDLVPRAEGVLEDEGHHVSRPTRSTMSSDTIWPSWKRPPSTTRLGPRSSA